MKCPHCGIDIPDNSTFCPYCGNKVTPISGSAEHSHSVLPPADEVPGSGASTPTSGVYQVPTGGSYQAPQVTPSSTSSDNKMTLIIILAIVGSFLALCCPIASFMVGLFLIAIGIGLLGMVTEGEKKASWIGAAVVIGFSILSCCAGFLIYYARGGYYY